MSPSGVPTGNTSFPMRLRWGMIAAMRSRATCDMVVLRALVVAALSLLLAALAHVSAGGLLPTAWTLGAMVLLTAAGAAMTLHRQSSRTELAVLLVGAQTTIHFVMTALAGHGDHGLSATTAHGALADALHHARHDLTANAAMMAAHLAAAAVTGIALGHAERALWAVLRLAARTTRFVELVLRAVPATPVPRAPRPPAPDADAAPRRTSVWLADTHVRRGPPALLPAH